MARFRLTEAHSTTKKLREVEKFMNDLGVSIRYDGYGRYTFVDNEKEFNYQDIEGDEVTEFPSSFETKLTFDE